MPLITTTLGFDLLYNTTAPISELITWRNTFATNIQSYFSAASNLAISLPGVPPDGYLYTFASLAPNPAGVASWIANINTLYNENTTEDETTWGNTLGGYIDDFFTTFLYTGTKQQVSTPFTVSPWTGTVSSNPIGTAALKAGLSALYNSGLDDINTWKSTMEQLISTYAQTCYCQYPTFTMI